MATSGVKHDFERFGLLKRQLIDVFQFVLRCRRVHFSDDKIGVIYILHHIIAVGDWSQISGMDGIRGWAYDRTLDNACNDAEKLGELSRCSRSNDRYFDYSNYMQYVGNGTR